MRNLIWLSDLALTFTILISTLCSCATCLETESGLQQEMVAAASHEPLLPGSPLNERYFRNYYEMLRDAEPVWKRAPAPGFFGMRGKKVPSSTFYGMRGKKGPSGFLGMRGKKSQDSTAAQQIALASSNGPPLMNLMGEGLKLQGPLSSGISQDSFDDYSLFGASGPSAGFISALKRVPTDGFLGVRGKRSQLASKLSVVGEPASSYK